MDSTGILRNIVQRTLVVYLGTIDVLRHLLKDEGARGLYKGCVPVLLRYNYVIYL